MPSLEALYQEFKDKPFVVIGIDIQEKKDIVARHVRQHNLSYPNLLDTDVEVSSQYGVRSTPAKFLIDTKGNMVGAALGYREWDSEEMKHLITALIKEGN